MMIDISSYEISDTVYRFITDVLIKERRSNWKVRIWAPTPVIVPVVLQHGDGELSDWYEKHPGTTPTIIRKDGTLDYFYDTSECDHEAHAIRLAPSPVDWQTCTIFLHELAHVSYKCRHHNKAFEKEQQRLIYTYQPECAEYALKYALTLATYREVPDTCYW